MTTESAPTVRVLDAREEIENTDQAVLAGALALPHATWCDYQWMGADGLDGPIERVLDEVYMDGCFGDRWDAAKKVIAAARPIILKEVN